MIAHPQLLGRLGPHFFRDKVTIQRAAETVDSHGQSTRTWNTTLFSNIPGAVEMLTKETQFRTEGIAEIKRETHRGILFGHYESAIDTATDRAKVRDPEGNESIYNIAQVGTDSQHRTTVLLLERVNPGKAEQEG